MLTGWQLRYIFVYATSIFLLACSVEGEADQKQEDADDTSSKERATIKPEDLCILCCLMSTKHVSV